MFHGVFISTEKLTFRSIGLGDMVAKMVSPSNDFGVYGQIYGHKGTGMNLFDV